MQPLQLAFLPGQKNPPAFFMTSTNTFTTAQPDISLLVAALNSFHPLSPAIQKYLKNHLQPVFVKKGKLLLKAGDTCEYVYFIKKGAIRGFIKEDNKDITTWITAEFELVTSIYALDKKQGATENIQAIENCELLAFNYCDIENLYELFPEFNIVIRKILQQYYTDAEGRAYITRLHNAENKYKCFIQRYPHLVNRIPLKYIASFLGITLETLSRVRKKLSTGIKKVNTFKEESF